MAQNNKDSLGFDPSALARAGAGIFGLATSAEDSLVHLINVPFDATASYGQGASLAPEAILRASHQLDLFDLELGKPYEAGIILLPAHERISLLNQEAKAAIKRTQEGGKEAGAALELANQKGEEINTLVRAAAKGSLATKKLVGLIGGDHSTPFAFIEELSLRHPGMGILHIDAHHDLRGAYEGLIWSHASIMFNVMTRLEGVAKLVQVGVRDFCEEEKTMVDESEGLIIAHYDQDLAKARFAGKSFDGQAQGIIEALPKKVYISFDIDGLDPKLCPNTGTPVPGGLEFNEAVRLLSLIVESGRQIIGFDLCEVAPGQDEWDGNVGARILYKLIGNLLMSQDRMT